MLSVDVRARVSGLIDKHNLDGRRTLAFWLGSALVAALVVLDAIPLNWAAQAFDLNNADSWLVTLILLVASVGAMAGLEAARQDSRRYAVLAAVTLTAYAGLVALRTSFLITVAGEGTAAALLQAVVLSAISAGLVFLGSAVMARTRTLRLTRALAAARRARRARQASEAAWRRAEEKLERHLGRAARAAGHAASVLRSARRADPLRVGGDPGACPPCPVHEAVNSLTKPPLDRPRRRQVGEAAAMRNELVMTLTWDEDAGGGDAGPSAGRAGGRDEPEPRRGRRADLRLRER